MPVPDHEKRIIVAVCILLLATIAVLLTWVIGRAAYGGTPSDDQRRLAYATPEGAIADTVALGRYIEARLAQERLDRLRAKWLPVHECEQGGTGWVNGGATSDGYFEGGMGHDARHYQSLAGHSANLDPPDVQMFWAEVAHNLGVHWAPGCEARIGG